jgi:hypothetical protein
MGKLHEESAAESLREAFAADSPERFADAVANVFASLACNAADGAQTCCEAWGGDRSAGAPWRQLARNLERHAASLRLNYGAHEKLADVLARSHAQDVTP